MSSMVPRARFLICAMQIAVVPTYRWLGTQQPRRVKKKPSKLQRALPRMRFLGDSSVHGVASTSQSLLCSPIFSPTSFLEMLYLTCFHAPLFSPSVFSCPLPFESYLIIKVPTQVAWSTWLNMPPSCSSWNLCGDMGHRDGDAVSSALWLLSRPTEAINHCNLWAGLNSSPPFLFLFFFSPTLQHETAPAVP